MMANFWDWLFGKGKHVQRDGPAHSSDRHGFWKELFQLRNHFKIEGDHSGSVDIYDHFGCAPYNDNDVKRERRDRHRPVLFHLKIASSDKKLASHAGMLLTAFDVADDAKGWRSGDAA